MILGWACSCWHGDLSGGTFSGGMEKPITHLEPAWQEAQSRTLEERGSGYVGKHEADVFENSNEWFRGMEVSVAQTERFMDWIGVIPGVP